MRFEVCCRLAGVNDEAGIPARFGALQHEGQLVRLDGLPAGLHLDVEKSGEIGKVSDAMIREHGLERKAKNSAGCC